MIEGADNPNWRENIGQWYHKLTDEEKGYFDRMVDSIQRKNTLTIPS